MRHVVFLGVPIPGILRMNLNEIGERLSIERLLEQYLGPWFRYLCFVYLPFPGCP